MGLRHTANVASDSYADPDCVSSFVTNTKIKKPEKCLVHGAHALLLRISKYAGLAPLKFEPHANGWVVSVSTSVWFYSYTLITVLLINTLWTITQDVQLDMKYSVRMNSSLGRGVALVDMLMIVLTACLGVYAAPMSMCKMIHYKSVLTEIDRRLDLHSGPPLERKIVMLGWMFLGYVIPFVFLEYWYRVDQCLELRKCCLPLYIYYLSAYGFTCVDIKCVPLSLILNDLPAFKSGIRKINKSGSIPYHPGTLPNFDPGHAIDSNSGPIHLEKVYDRVKRHDLWRTLSMHGVSSRLIQALQYLHRGSNACVRINDSYTDWFDIRRGVRQRCVTWPWLFNLFMDSYLYVLKEYAWGSRMDEHDLILASSAYGQQERGESTIEYKVLIEGEKVEQVKDIVYFGSLFTNDDTVAYQYIGFYIQCIIVIILELQFTFTTLTVVARFTALNDALAQTAMEAGVSGLPLFAKGRSTSEAGVELIEQIFGAWEESRDAINVFCDLFKLFDCVHHDTLIRKPRRFGVRYLSFGLLESYLGGRVHRVDINVDEPSVRARSKLFEVSSKIPVLERRKNLNMKVGSPTNLLDPAVIVRHHTPVDPGNLTNTLNANVCRPVGGTARLAVAPHEAVRRLAALHGALCDVVTELGASYSLPLVVILLSTLLHLIVSPYYLVVDLVSLQPRPAFAAMQSLWSINHMFRLLMIVEPCYLTKLQYVQHILNIREVTGTVQRVLQFEPKQLLCETAMFRKVLRQLGRQIDLSVDFVRLFHQRKEVFGDFTHASTGVSCLPLLARWSNHLLCVRQRKPVVVRCHLFGEAAHLAIRTAKLLSTDHQRSGQTAGDPSGDLQPAALSALHVLFANGNMRFGPSARSFG
ncbi:Gustatory receptor for sugar taste 43a [Eumeta japonica]|uniref:Gustatory receptor for sugar taste 43a n=1 Tax=Eumeta variegata TaxID=151549 RepID=A0A4C1WTP4_EUMVA|nr:Gustatory receptor for sugar taste 43a [Eumeta japonica]